MPNFIGMDPDEVKKTLRIRYPSISYHIYTYSSPRDGKVQDASVLYRIVRQKQIGDNQLEFIISPFTQ